ncbi:hypothetical protein Daus18300_006336 [Diaporthe australafricana]|uniref:Protein kinase domain-containing protein n=1 Tax=Diaporthe australafricana TaxID=127596 RepID=A0ABR3WVM9_9PEZI
MGQQIDNIQLYNDWGDYVSEDKEYDITDLTEGIDEYAIRTDYPGLPCYPVTVGELIKGDGKSYRIEHKLGHGAFSTTWLALEVEANTSVALKIHRTLTTAGQTEGRIHQELRKSIPDPDINDRNVMLGLITDALDQRKTPSERYKQVGRPQKFALPSCDFGWKAGDLVAPIEWPSSMVAKTAFLSDFGSTRRAGSAVVDYCLPPRECCPPELFHKGFEPTYESDMWGFMCVFATLMTGSSPFSGWSESGTLGCIYNLLGPLPQEWEGLYKWPEEYADEERRKWYGQPARQEGSLEDYLDRCREDLVGSRERELILDLMRKGFRYKPSQRITAQQFMDDKSFLELMSIHGME